MPYFGVHASIAEGYHNAVLKASSMGFDCVQIFSKNSNQWHTRPISPKEAELFKSAICERKIMFPLIHDSYLINLASAKPDVLSKSVKAFSDELNRASVLGIRQIVMHPGTPTGDDSDDADAEKNGLARIAESLDKIFEQSKSTDDFQVEVLLETTAGQGSNLGWKFEHLAEIINLSRFSERLGVCFDTCHVFAAGYKLSAKKDYNETMKQFDKIIGIKRLKAFHLNDSAKPFGSRVDRHAHIGQGHIGLDCFKNIVTDSRFAELPMYLETPKGTVEIDGEVVDCDVVNLKMLKSILTK
ncbi:MAG: deoxyribonuclease IV [Planctomycetaceae bacterium]|jgi:deoxyribonuclease-4|nr:deoxyribonuclease IV [Planctomycetaceae bacterium]